jgi:N-methylhydantoinase B
VSAFAINVPKAYTDAYTTFGVRCLMGPAIPNNAGSLSTVRVTAPEGCILNAPFPLAVAARSVVGQMLPDVVRGCLAQARPDAVPAGGTSCLWNVRLSGGQTRWRSGSAVRESRGPEGLQRRCRPRSRRREGPGSWTR